MNAQLTLDAEPIALLLIVAALAAAVWAYATRYPVLPPRRRAILLGTRLLTLFLLLAASLAPVARVPTASKARNRLLVLVDHSGSMDVRDVAGGRSRRAAADSAAAAIASKVGGRLDVRVASFDASLGPFARGAAAGGTAPAAGERGETALGDALREALTRVDPDSVAALLVLSDGAVNRGEDPERAVDASIPTFALAVGAAADPPTVGIAGVEAPGEAVAGRPAAVTVTVRQGARGASRGVARLSERGREIARAPFALEGPGAAARVSIPFTSTEIGKHFLSVTLDQVTGDPMRENKERLIAITVRPAKHRLVLLASSWDWDLRSLARGVTADTTWTVERLEPSGPEDATPLGGTPAPLASFLDGADAVALRYDGKDITAGRAAALLRYLERGGGVLFWIDPNGHPPMESPLGNALGLTWRFWNDDPGATATAELTPAGRTNDVTLLGGDAASAAATWRELPPVRPPVMMSARGGALTPILVGRIEDAPVAPLLFAGRIASGRVAVLNAAGVYRWGLTAAGLAGAAGVEPTFFGGLARWLASADEDRAVHLSAPDITPEGRSIAVQLSVSTPVGSGARATVRARRIGGGPGSGPAIVDTTLARGDGGVFSGAIRTPPGTYELAGRVVDGGRAVGADSLRVAVGAQGIEFESLAAEPDLLERTAARTGGVAAPLSAPGPVLARLESPDLARSHLAEIDLFHNPYLFAVIVLGLAAEWTLRRRFHLM
ncbi:MAG: hypothetical protein ACM3JJ_04130 [Hyphomicrobiales bacterium]